MKKLKIQLVLAATAILTLLSPQAIFGQFDMTLYHLRPAIQSNLSNPAFIPEFQYHFGVPGLSSVYAQYGNSGLRWNQIFSRRSDDSLSIDFDGIGSNVKKKNNLSMRMGIQWINGGMKWKDFYFSMAISEYVDWTMFYNDDLINLAINGNGPYVGETLEAGPSYLKATHYREYAFGAAWDFDSQWNFGARVKMYFGKSNVTTQRLNASLHTAENTYYLTTENDILIDASIPKSWFDGSDEGFQLNSDYLFYNGNFGLGFDLGATYKLDDKFSFSLSVLDLGYMKFDRNFVNYSSNSVKWSFEGIDPLQFEDMSDAQIEDRLEQMGDSLINKFDIKESWTSYNIMMTAKIYAAATYQLSDIERIGAVLRSEIVNKTWRPAFTASYYRQILDDLGVIGSYTMANRGYFNIGVGAYYNIAPVQIYLVTDNLPGLFVPDAVRLATIHFGVNIFLPEKKSGNTLIKF